jgi:hypothetical protein
LKTLLFTVVFAAICTCVAMAPLPAHADWDPVAEAREAAARKKAADAAAKRNAEMSAKRADALRKALARPPYNVDPASMARMNESELKALGKQQEAKLVDAQKAMSAQALDQMADAMKSLTPEQRAMIEKQAGVKIGDLMKQLQPAVKK